MRAGGEGMCTKAGMGEGRNFFDYMLVKVFGVCVNPPATTGPTANRNSTA